MISIIIPVYNQAKYLDRCLKSIFAQTYKNFEIIVVNDGSTDKLYSVIRKWKSKIKFFDLKVNRGAPFARNYGAKQAKGEYFLFCDADIVMKTDMLDKMLIALTDNPEVAYAYSSFKFGWKKFKLWPFDAIKLKTMPYIHTASLMRQGWFLGFDESLKKFQDWDLWLTILDKGGQGVWINQVLFKVSGGGTMSRWVPKWVFKLPFKFGPWGREVEKYDIAKAIIEKKHHLN